MKIVQKYKGTSSGIWSHQPNKYINRISLSIQKV